MSEIGFEINARTYRVNCDDGQESHIRHLAQALDLRAKALEKTSGSPVAEARLMMLMALTLADEQAELQKKLTAAEEETRSLRIKLAAERGKASGNGWKSEVGPYEEDVEALVADLLTGAAQRLELLAARFEPTIIKGAGS